VGAATLWFLRVRVSPFSGFGLCFHSGLGQHKCAPFARQKQQSAPQPLASTSRLGVDNIIQPAPWTRNSSGMIVSPASRARAYGVICSPTAHAVGYGMPPPSGADTNVKEPHLGSKALPQRPEQDGEWPSLRIGMSVLFQIQSSLRDFGLCMRFTPALRFAACRAKYNRRSAALARIDVSEAGAEAPFVFGVFFRTA
jgi:hypothetical protein